jgi:regulator of protease activity HflC (stomatin/prohibitin superfamily)
MRLGGGGPPGGGPPAGYRGNFQQNYARDYSREFGGENTVKTAGIVGAAVALFLLVWGIANVEVTEYALNYSLLTRKVEDRTYTSGRYWIGPFNYFIRFPAVVKTIQFSEGKMQFDLPTQERSSGLLRSRTSDGLDVNIELSFQYQLQPESLHNLYTTLGGAPDYHNLFVRVAIDRLTETATMYSATSFFVDRTKIGKAMEAQLRADFEERLFATIFSFQLRSVQLPQEFEDAIQETEVMKQDMQVAEAEQSSTRVALETELMKAKRRTRVRANKADASAQSTMLANSADIEQYTLTQHKAADSYAEVLKALDGKESDVLEYIESRVLRDHPSGLVTVGLGLSAAKGKDAL